MRAAAWLVALMGPLIGPLTAAAQVPLRLGTLDEAAVAEPTNKVLREAYERAGQQVQFEPLPLRRSAQMLKEGQLDGDFMRTPAFFEANPEILRVEPALRHVSYWVHRRPPCRDRPQWEDLKQGRVAYLRGAAIIESQLPESARDPANGMGDALARVNMGRVEASVLALTPGMLNAVRKDFPGLCHDRLPLVSVDFFHALAPRHAALKPKLEAALRSMQRDGFTVRVWAETEPKLESWASRGRPRQAGSAPVASPPS